MRKIEFRGKRVEEPIKIKHYAPDGWVYGDFITCDDGNFILPHDISGEMYIDRPYKFRANDVEARVMLAKVGENTIGQYTGLKDKNGTKIFEGDIIKGITEDTNQARYGVIKYGKYKDENFEDSCLGVYFEFEGEQFSIFNGEAQGYDLPSLIEVIGNIYDNPELLEDADVKD